MTVEQTAAVIALIRLTWPHSNLGGDPKKVILTWHSFLKDTDPAAVENAVKELAATGREHAPGVPAILATAAARHTDTPDWDEAWAEIERLKTRFNPGYPGRETPPSEAFTHPVIAAFAIPAWREMCLGPAPGTRDFGTFYAQTRDAYRALSHRATRNAALGAVGAPRRRSELTRPDYLAALPKAAA